MCEAAEPLHRVFRNSPLQLMKALHCRVRVRSSGGSVQEGGLLAVDPVSDTALLVRLGQEELELERLEVVLVPLVDWGSLEVLESSAGLRERLAGLVPPEGGGGHGLTSEQVVELREQTVAWLQKNGLPVQVEGDQVVIAGAVRLEPPYTGESALADNEIVLSRVQAVLDSRPHTV